MKKILAMLLLAAILLMAFAGCGNATAASAGEASAASAASAAEEAPAEEAPAEEAAEEPAEEAPAAEPAASVEETAEPEEAAAPESSISYPMCTDGSASISLWVSMPSQISPYMESVADSACYRAASEATGITLNATTVGTEVQDEQFQLMCASGTILDYDIVIGASTSYGGADAAIDDGILMDVSGVIESYMPDYYAFLQGDEEIRKLLTTDSGYMADIAGRGTGGRPQGFGIRKDWLDNAGLEIPTTYDELYNVLKTFKSEENCAEPLLMYSTGFLDNDFLCGGMGVTQNGFYVDNGTVKYCYTEDSFKEYCQLINQWYNEGLVSADFINNVQGAGISYDSKMQDGTLGVFMTGVDIFSSGSAAAAEQDGWEAVPMADVTKTGTETITIGNTPSNDPLSNRWNVTAEVSDEQLPYVLGYINWFFTEDGSIAANFGIEGEGFEYDQDGNPVLTELVTNNPEGLSSFISEAMYLNWNACFCIDSRYYDSIYDTEAQASATDVWNSNRNNTQQFHGDLTADENAEYSALYNDIDTYVETMTVSFMTGSADIDAEWDTFVSKINEMDIDSCIALKQAAYDRYLER